VRGLGDDVECFRQALARYRSGDHPGAIDWLERAASLAPGNADYRYTLGQLLKVAGNSEPAERHYRAALEIQPRHLEAWVALGVLLRTLGRHAESEACQRQALGIDPANVGALVNLGNILLQQRDFSAAAGHYRRALELDPGLAQAHNNLGKALLELGQREDALLCLHRALKLNPGYFEAVVNLGMAQQALGFPGKAIEAFQHAAALNPQSLEAASLLAKAYFDVKLLPEAEAAWEQALRLDPQHPVTPVNLAIVYQHTGKLTKAKNAFERALAKSPDEAFLRWNYAPMLLREGELARGWDYYEARMGMANLSISTKRDIDLPRWKGEALAGRRLLVISEQGLGDEIMFASLVPDLVARGTELVLECDPRLAPIYTRSFPSCRILPLKRTEAGWQDAFASKLKAMPPVDYWTPAGSLPRHFRRRAEDFPAHRGYLLADAAKVQRWRQRLAELGPGRKIGLSWSGGTLQTNILARSLELEALLDGLKARDAAYVSLQYTPCAEEIAAAKAATGVTVHHWQDAIDDYDETAALVGALDLVISVCTAVVHLGGALGRPVWVAAPFLPEWRYGRTGPGMAWYPSVRMFRQARPDVWKPVLAELSAALRIHPSVTLAA
jgi:tetratricopeptide (TPR) repeat protein